MEKIMEDCTIIIQGKIEQDSYDFYKIKYHNCPVIISTWTDCKIDFSELPKNFNQMKNYIYQIISLYMQR